MLEPDASLAPQTRLGPYRIEELLGAGGMGQVYGSLMAVPIDLDPVEMAVRPGKPERLFSTRLAGGVLQPVARQQYVPALDGSRFLMHAVSGETSRAPITVVLNWRPKAQPTSP